VYASIETHAWIHKAADCSGLGTASIRWIGTDKKLRMDVEALRRQIEADVDAGDVPCLVVGTAGSVSTGAVDPLPDRRYPSVQDFHTRLGAYLERIWPGRSWQARDVD